MHQKTTLNYIMHMSFKNEGSQLSIFNAIILVLLKINCIEHERNWWFSSKWGRKEIWRKKILDWVQNWQNSDIFRVCNLEWPISLLLKEMSLLPLNSCIFFVLSSFNFRARYRKRAHRFGYMNLEFTYFSFLHYEIFRLFYSNFEFFFLLC